MPHHEGGGSLLCCGSCSGEPMLLCHAVPRQTSLAIPTNLQFGIQLAFDTCSLWQARISSTPATFTQHKLPAGLQPTW